MVETTIALTQFDSVLGLVCFWDPQTPAVLGLEGRQKCVIVLPLGSRLSEISSFLVDAVATILRQIFIIKCGHGFIIDWRLSRICIATLSFFLPDSCTTVSSGSSSSRRSWIEAAFSVVVTTGIGGRAAVVVAVAEAGDGTVGGIRAVLHIADVVDPVVGVVVGGGVRSSDDIFPILIFFQEKPSSFSSSM